MDSQRTCSQKHWRKADLSQQGGGGSNSLSASIDSLAESVDRLSQPGGVRVPNEDRVHRRILHDHANLVAELPDLLDRIVVHAASSGDTRDEWAHQVQTQLRSRDIPFDFPSNESIGVSVSRSRYARLLPRPV